MGFTVPTTSYNNLHGDRKNAICIPQLGMPRHSMDPKKLTSLFVAGDVFQRGYGPEAHSECV